MKHTHVESYGYVYGYALSEAQAQQKFRTAQLMYFPTKKKKLQKYTIKETKNGKIQGLKT